MDATWHCSQAPVGLLDWAHQRLVGVKNVERVDRVGSDRLVVTVSSYPSWVILVAILFFPVGLLALLARSRGALDVWAAPDPSGGTRLEIHGMTTPAVRQRLAEMWRQLEAQGSLRPSENVIPGS